MLAGSVTEPPTRPIAPTPEPATAASIRTLVVQADGIAFEDLQEALALRAEGTRIVSHPRPAAGAPLATPFAHAQLAPTDEGRWSISVVVSDGRAFEREVDVVAGDEARLLANHLANLLVAIAEGRVEPARRDAAMPPGVETSPPPSPADPCPTPTPDSQPDREPPSVPTSAPPAQSRLEFGPTIAAETILGLGPPGDVDRHAGAGGSFGLGLRTPRGALVVGEFRAAGRGSATGAAITRLRVAIGGGYTHRWAHAELGLAILATAEPWLVRRGGASVRYEGGATALPLVGGLVRISPGLRLTPARGPALRVGLRVEFAVSGEPQGGRTVVVRDAERLFRAGGMELGTGVELELWFPAGGRRRSPS